MARQVFCKKYKKMMDALATPPYGGPIGQEVFEHYSRKAWEDWTQLQTRLINEKQLSMINKEHRDYLQDQMRKFLNNEECDMPEGYVPPKEG